MGERVNGNLLSGELYVVLNISVLPTTIYIFKFITHSY